MHVYSAMNTCCIVNALIRLALRVNCEGVYDGHGGRQVADFLEETLENTIYQELVVDDDASIPERLARYVPSFLASQFLVDFYGVFLHSAFLITDMESMNNGLTTSGATCVSALLHNSQGRRTLYIANVGDSRAVLCSKLDEATG